MERELNSELTKVDDLINAARADEEGITIKEVPFNLGNENQEMITLIVLEGYPLKTIQTSISIYSTDEQTHQTTNTLKNNPAFFG